MNLDVPAAIKTLLEQEAERGPTMTASYCAAIFWYFNRLSPADREEARSGYRKWLEQQPADGIGDELANRWKGKSRKRKPPRDGRDRKVGGIG